MRPRTFRRWGTTLAVTVLATGGALVVAAADASADPITFFSSEKPGFVASAEAGND